MKQLITALRLWWVDFRKTGGDFLDLFKPRGQVELRLIHAAGPQKGQVAQIIKGRNVVTSWLSIGGGAPTSGRDMMRRILISAAFPGDELSSDPDATIQTIRLGAGSTAETASDMALDTAIVGSDKAISSVTLDGGSPYVTFITEYDEGEVNVAISEASLESGRGDFIARKTFGQFNKTNEFTLQVRWTIRF